MRQLTEAEIARLNQIIGQCELLVKTRGQQNSAYGAYENQDFEIVIKASAMESDCRIRHRGDIVLEVRWTAQRKLGHVVVEPGAWQGDLLALPAAHA